MIKPGVFSRIAHALWQTRIADENDPDAGFSIVRAREEPDFAFLDADHPAGEPIDDTARPVRSASAQAMRVAFVRAGQVQEGIVLVMHPDESMLVQPDDGSAPLDVDPSQLVEPAPADADDVSLPSDEVPVASLQSIVEEMRRLVGMHRSAANFNQDYRPGAILEATKGFDPVLMDGTPITVPAGAMLRVDGLHGPDADQGYAPGKLPLVEPGEPKSFANSRIRMRPIDPRFGAGEIVPGYEYILLTPGEFASNFKALPPITAPTKAVDRPPPSAGTGAQTRVTRMPERAPDNRHRTLGPGDRDYRPMLERFGPDDQLWSNDDDAGAPFADTIRMPGR